MLALGGMLFGASGCSTEGIIGGSVGATLVGANTPSNEIEQVYYLGSFDPEDQLPPTIYRVTVRGQASAISAMKFGSGWVPAQLVDSLSSNVRFDKTGSLKFDKDDETMANLETGRRLILFGPEGFREAPRDYRLAIVMGSSPEDFFNAIDQTLGTVSQVQAEQLTGELKNKLVKELLRVKDESSQLTKIKADVRVDLAGSN